MPFQHDIHPAPHQIILNRDLYRHKEDKQSCFQLQDNAHYINVKNFFADMLPE